MNANWTIKFFLQPINLNGEQIKDSRIRVLKTSDVLVMTSLLGGSFPKYLASGQPQKCLKLVSWPSLKQSSYIHLIIICQHF